MEMGRNNKRAFTLVELLVVISIIALLLAILMPSLQKVREQTKKITCLSGLRQLGLGCYLYAMDNNDKLPPATTSGVSSGTYKIYMGGWAGLGTIYKTGYITDLNVYWCPNAKDKFSQKYNMDRGWVNKGDYRDPLPNSQNENVLRSYQFRGLFFEKEKKKCTDVPRSAVAMDVFLSGASPFHPGGYNVTFLDGSGSFFRVDPKNNELDYMYRNPTAAPGYLTWRQYYTTWDWRGGRAVWAALDVSY